jgi:APA family basic amino acid/polyamine antiporter
MATESVQKPEAQKVFVRTASGLVRSISPKDAMIVNTMFMMLTAIYVFGNWDVGLYPGSNLWLTYIIVWPPSVLISLIYVLLAASMPRTGGDYIWVGRTLKPILGFMSNFWFTMVALAWVGTVPAWATLTGFAAFLLGYGVQTNNAGLIGLGQYLNTPLPTFLITSGIIVAFLSTMFFGSKKVTRTTWGLFALNTIGVVLLSGTLFVLGSGTFASGFNHLSAASGGLSYSQVIATAQKAGYLTGLSLIGSFLGISYAYQNTLGYTSSVYYAGEIKSGNMVRAHITSIIGATILFTVYCVIQGLSFYVGFGQSFYHAVSFLAVSGSSSYTLPSFPTATFLIAYDGIPVWLLALIAIGAIAGAAAQPLTKAFVASRNVFAWAFDRVIPPYFSNVSRRWGTPFAAVALVIAIGLFLNVLGSFTTVFNYFTFMMLLWVAAEVIVSLTAILFPYLRKDIFEASPDAVKKKVGGIPVLSIMGGLAIAFLVYVFYAISYPLFSGSISIAGFEMFGILLVVPIIIYAASVTYYRKKGVPIDLAHRQLPPE